MTIPAFIDSLARRPAVRHTTLWFPDAPPQDAPAAAADRYFSIRLSEMYLQDARRWLKEICPASLFIVDYQYGQEDVSHPFFVSSKSLAGTEKAGAGAFRVHFADQRILGPTPYAGGDVNLFVGLFQATLIDYRSELFSVLETVLGGMDLGLASAYFRMADKLSADLLKILGMADVECLLAEQRVIGKQAAPASGYRAYLRLADGSVAERDFVVQDGLLQRKSAGSLRRMDQADYCLVRVDTMESRSDYTKMAFHLTWSEARKKMLTSETEALGLMHACNVQILGSPDLTESHKLGLIEYYQSKLWATARLRNPSATEAQATRTGDADFARAIQRRIRYNDEPQADALADALEGIAHLSNRYAQGVHTEREDDMEAELLQHLRASRKAAAHPTAAELVQAIAAGTVAVSEPRS